MKLQVVPARTGARWVVAGMRTFARQPIGLGGLFLLFFTVVSLLSLIPLLGNVLSLVLLPGATLGLMAAAHEVQQGRFPRPVLLVQAFRGRISQRKAMLQLGGAYTVAFLLLLTASALVDGGVFASTYLWGAPITAETLQSAEFQSAMLLTSALGMPVSLWFWHAAALVHWNQVPATKALFFAIVAFVRNAAAFTLYGLAWMAVFVLVALLVASIAGLIGGGGAVAVTMMPTALLLAAMFFASVFFSYRDCYAPPDTQEPP